jgi:predicted nucleotidyltransferase
MPPSELAKCRENLKRQWENRQVDEELLQRAWAVAHRLAAVLYQDYGASKVAVFGSLAERERFTKYSDIDIVVWGVSYNKCLDALWGTEDLGSEFKIDIINFKSINRSFRERILSQAILIDKGETDTTKMIKETDSRADAGTGEIDKVNREKLIQRIFDERQKIEKTVERIGRALEKIDVLPIDAREFVERALAADLAEVYTGFEKIFEQIAKEVDKYVPSGGRWHNDLLTQMAEHRSERPPVISEVTRRRLRRLLRFRHKANNIYGDELIYEKAEKHAQRVGKLFDNVSEELDAFAAFLSDT